MADSASGDQTQDEHNASRPGILMGRPFGIPVYMSPTWFIVAILIMVNFEPAARTLAGRPASIVIALIFAVLILGSVLAHELSHSVVARLFGLPVRAITLHVLGGVSEIEREPRTPGREFLVAFAGPLLSLVLGVAGYAAYVWAPLPPAGRLLVEALSVANLVVGVFNLLPGLPLDGGRIVRALVWKLTGRPRTATVVAGWIGRGVAVLVLALSARAAVTGGGHRWLVLIWGALVASFIWVGAGDAIRTARLRERIPSLHARDLARRAVRVSADLPLSEAIRRAQEAQAGSIIVVDHDDRPVAIVSEPAVNATPFHRRPWVEAGALSRVLDPGLILSADLAGEDLLAAVRRAPATEYLLVEDCGEVYGVLVTDDVNKTFAGV